MSETFDAATLAALAAADEIAIEVPRADGRAPVVPIWVVVADGEVYARSARGGRGRWYRALLAHPDATIRVNDRRIPVRGIRVEDAAVIGKVDAAYQAKYGGSPYLPPLFEEESRRCTVCLVPR